MNRMIISRTFLLLLAFACFGAVLTSCQKFPDPGLDQETYKPDSSTLYAANPRRVLFVSIDGLPADAVQTIAPPNITALLSNSKYSWEVKPLVVIGGETDVTRRGTLAVRLEHAGGAANAEGSSRLTDSIFTNMYSCGPITAILPNLWMRLQFATNRPLVEAYTVTSGSGTVLVRDPTAWVFEGSMDGSIWTVLDRQSNQTFTARSQTKKYRFESRVAYQYYRLVVASIVNIAATGYYHQGEWRLIQNDYLDGINNASWGSMMTGNNRNIHRIWDSTFYAKPVDTTNSIPVSPNLTALRLLHDYNENIKSVAISSWGNLVNTFLRDANRKVVTSSDEDTKNKAVEMLKQESAQVFITQFGDVFNTRLATGPSNSDPQFVAAVNKTDTYIKELTDAIKSRPDYSKEEWVVVITSTQGGSGTGTPVDLSSGFIVLHNPLFRPQDLTKMNPAITVKQEDVARQILYWMKVPTTPAIQTGSLWLDRFGAEFIK